MMVGLCVERQDGSNFSALAFGWNFFHLLGHGKILDEIGGYCGVGVDPGPLWNFIGPVRQYGGADARRAKCENCGGADRGILLWQEIFRRKDTLLGLSAQAKARLESCEVGDDEGG